MRVKTDARRDAILETATELFREVGYERASMAEISARLGGSKATLYNYFKSKGELFAAAMMDVMEERGQALIDLLNPSDEDVRAVLARFGEAYLHFVTGSDTLAITRTAIAEGANSQLGADLYERGPRRAWATVADYIKALQERGQIGAGDSFLIAAHLKALLEAGFVEPLMWGAEPDFPPSVAVPAAIEAFLRAYGGVSITRA